MNRSFKVKLIFALLPMALWSLAAGAGTLRETASPDGEKSAAAEITPEPVRLGESAEMTVTVTLPAGQETVAPEFGAVYGAFTVESVRTDPPVLTGGRHKSVYRVRLIPNRGGTLFLPPIAVDTQGAEGESDTLLIPAGKIEAASQVDPESADLSQLAPPRPPIRHFPWILAAALLAGAVTFALLARGLFRRSIRFAEKELPPRERALRRLAELAPVGVGVSRKRLVKKITGGKCRGKNIGGSVGAAVWCAMNGAALVRVHDVEETSQALAVARAFAAAELPQEETTA